MTLRRSAHCNELNLGGKSTVTRSPLPLNRFLELFPCQMALVICQECILRSQQYSFHRAAGFLKILTSGKYYLLVLYAATQQQLICLLTLNIKATFKKLNIK